MVKRTKPHEHSKVSVVIPCRNEEIDIRDCIESITYQTFPREWYEIIVVDGGSTDKTLEIIKEYKHVRVIQEYGEHRSPANARNIGALNAKADIVAFMDADTVFNETYLENAYRHFEDPAVVSVTALSKDVKDTTFLAKCYYAERVATNPKVHKGVHCVRKDIFEKLGGFNPKLGAGEDADLWRRFTGAGYKSVFEPKSISHHKEPRTWSEIWRESKWFGRTYLTLLFESPVVGIKPMTAIAFRCSAPVFLGLWLLNGNFLSFIISFIWVADYSYKTVKALFVSRYILPSLLLPFFKTIRYYMLLLGMFTKK